MSSGLFQMNIVGWLAEGVSLHRVMAHNNVWWVDVYFEMAKFAVRVFHHAKLHYKTSRTIQTVIYLLYIGAGCLKLHPLDLKKPITSNFFLKKWPAHEMSKTTHPTAYQLHFIISSYQQNFPPHNINSVNSACHREWRFPSCRTRISQEPGVKC